MSEKAHSVLFEYRNDPNRRREIVSQAVPGDHDQRSRPRFAVSNQTAGVRLAAAPIVFLPVPGACRQAADRW